jgi:hypothetical protein
MMNKTTLRVLAAISLVLWVTALFMPAFWVDAGSNSAMYEGYVVALWGPISFVTGVFSWYANPYWAYATVRMAMGRKPNLIFVFANSLLAASFLRGFSSVGANEGSTGEAIPQIGAWVWLAAFVPAFVPSVPAAIRATHEIMRVR